MIVALKERLCNSCDGTAKLEWVEEIVISKEFINEFTQQLQDLIDTFQVRSVEEYEAQVASANWGNNTQESKKEPLENYYIKLSQTEASICKQSKPKPQQRTFKTTRWPQWIHKLLWKRKCKKAFRKRKKNFQQEMHTMKLNLDELKGAK